MHIVGVDPKGAESIEEQTNKQTNKQTKIHTHEEIYMYSRLTQNKHMQIAIPLCRTFDTSAAIATKVFILIPLKTHGNLQYFTLTIV